MESGERRNSRSHAYRIGGGQGMRFKSASTAEIRFP